MGYRTTRKSTTKRNFTNCDSNTTNWLFANFDNFDVIIRIVLLEAALYSNHFKLLRLFLWTLLERSRSSTLEFQVLKLFKVIQEIQFHQDLRKSYLFVYLYQVIQSHIWTRKDHVYRDFFNWSYKYLSLWDVITL